jgi:AAA domain
MKTIDYEPAAKPSKRGNGQAKPPKFTLTPFEEIKLGDAQEWLVKKLLPRRGTAAFYGASGSVKTFILLDICLHIALALTWAGRAVTQAPVIYVADDGLKLTAHLARVVICKDEDLEEVSTLVIESVQTGGGAGGFEAWRPGAVSPVSCMMASRKLMPSRCMTRSTTPPPFWQPRQFQACFAVFTLNRSKPPQIWQLPQRSILPLRRSPRRSASLSIRM